MYVVHFVCWVFTHLEQLPHNFSMYDLFPHSRKKMLLRLHNKLAAPRTIRRKSTLLFVCWQRCFLCAGRVALRTIPPVCVSLGCTIAIKIPGGCSLASLKAGLGASVQSGCSVPDPWPSALGGEKGYRQIISKINMISVRLPLLLNHICWHPSSRRKDVVKRCLTDR